MRIRIMHVVTSCLAGVAMLAAAGTADAQGRGKSKSKDVPPGHMPPAGMCRIWLDGVPPGRQPAPTSCADAERRAPRNARVIYGSSVSRDSRDDRDRNRDRDDRTRDDRTRDDRTRDDRDRNDCVDRDRDGRCDYTEGRASVPEMVWGVVFGRGQRVDDVRRIVGNNVERSRVTDANRNGVPETVTWLDGDNNIIQRWIDDDRDGRADRIAIYQNGRVMRVIRP